MRDETGAFDVPQKTRSQAGAEVGALDQSGQVRDHEAAAHAGTRAVHGDDAEVRLERCEGIGSNLGPCRGDPRNQGGFSGVGKADEPHVGQKLQLQS